VEAHKAGSHQNRGWERFTDRVISILSEKKENLVFILWGSYAQQKGKYIDVNKHLVLKAVHPSPLSAYRGFFGCKHFSLTNNFLESKGIKPIDW
jgi:uracil-DNA glycosylase